MTHQFSFARRGAIALAASLTFALTLPAPAEAAAKIQHLISPGGIEAWFVQDATVPLIAMEYAFSGGAAQDPVDKPGVGRISARASEAVRPRAVRRVKWVRWFTNASPRAWAWCP